MSKKRAVCENQRPINSCVCEIMDRSEDTGFEKGLHVALNSKNAIREVPTDSFDFLFNREIYIISSYLYSFAESISLVYGIA